MAYFYQKTSAFNPRYLKRLRDKILSCSYLTNNNLNRDFVATRGFSVAFRRSGIGQVEEEFPFFMTYLNQILLPDCNAFYLNPLWLTTGSRVDPHIDRSLRSYCKTVEPPAWVSVLYIEVPEALQGGDLILRHGKRQVGQIRPQINMVLYFQGDLTHSVMAVTSEGIRLSLVCEQYELTAEELEQIPDFIIESRLGKRP